MDRPAQDRRARWLADRYEELGLANYPTFDEIVSHYRTNRVEGLVWNDLPEVRRRNRHRIRIVEAMKEAGLVPLNTKWQRVTLDTLIAPLKERHGDYHVTDAGGVRRRPDQVLPRAESG
jgi:hypothetical protein